MGIQGKIGEPLRFERLALPCTLLFEVGLFLDTFTTAWIVNFAGTNAELNPFVRPFLGYFTIPWITINLLAMLMVPPYVTGLQSRGVYKEYVPVILIGMGALGAWRMATGISNLIQIYFSI